MHQVDNATYQFAKERFPDIIGWVPCLYGKGGQPHFNTTKFVLPNNQYVSVFAIKPVYYEALGGFWRPLSEITKHHGNRKIVLNDKWRMATPRFIDWLSKRQALLGSELLLPTPFGNLLYQDIARPVVNIGLTTTVVYPDPSPETTTVDGYARYNSTGVVWATIIAANGTQSSDAVASDILWQISGSTNTGASSTFDVLTRTFTLFDTSSLGDSDTINAGNLSLFCTSKLNEFSVTPNMTIMGATTASNTAIAASDFQGTFSNQTAFSVTRAFADFVTNDRNEFHLNATGLAAVSTTGVTKLGLRIAEDITGGTTPQQGSAAREFNVACSGAEVAGVVQDPKLTIVHTSPLVYGNVWAITA